MHEEQWWVLLAWREGSVAGTERNKVGRPWVEPSHHRGLPEPGSQPWINGGMEKPPFSSFSSSRDLGVVHESVS